MADRHIQSETHQTDPTLRSRLRIVRESAIDGVLRSMDLGHFDLELGGHIDNVTLAFRTWGTLNDAGDNAVIVLHALTGDSNAAGPDGWWNPIIGSGKPIDTETHFVVCANILGGCQGSTGPSSINPETGTPWGMTFPLVTIGDMVSTQRRLVERLGITKLIAIGGSIGGFQALEWATRHADLVKGVAPLAASASLDAQGIATHSELGRRAIMADPNWRNGEYQQAGVFPEQGLAIARMAAMVTYNGRDNLNDRFGRNTASRPVLYPTFGQTFDIEGYLHYHGEALVRRFDANSYLYLTRAMDLYDVDRNGGPNEWLEKVDVPILLAGISSDWLFPAVQIEILANRFRQLGKDVTYVEIESPHGHDSFLKDWDQFTPLIAGFMNGLDGVDTSSTSIAGG
jgi:homoserine O-acetyltransferase